MSNASSAAVRDLRELLGKSFPDAIPLERVRTEVVPTGIGALDGILPNGGFPRGRLAAWAPGGGATAVLRSACRQAVRHGERAVWIDGGAMVAGAFWERGPILVKPKSRLHALRAAETLLRSGGFALVILAGAEPEGTENVRLSRAAHEGGGACVALTSSGSMAALRASSTLRPKGYVWRRDPHGDPAVIDAATLDVRVHSLGWSRHARLTIPVRRDELRMALEADMPDRRGVGRRASGVGMAASGVERRASGYDINAFDTVSATSRGG